MISENIHIDHEVEWDAIEMLAKMLGWIYYGANTPWWTADSANLYRGAHGLPCDPRGGMLFQTDKPEDFLKAAKDGIAHYGKHGLRTFLLAYHGCVVAKVNGKRLPTCLNSWDDYNNLIDRSAQEVK